MSTVKIGWARRNISTEKPVHIPGQFYMRISKGIKDPLFAEVLLVENGGLAVFVSVDTTTLRYGILDGVRKLVSDAIPNFDVQNIIITATHIHTAPSTMFGDEPIYRQMPDSGIEVASSDEYREFLISEIASAIVEAYENRTEGGISYGYGYATTSYSRRVVYFDDISKRGGQVSGFMVDGHCQMYGNTSDDMFSHYEAGTDATVNILFTFDTKGKLTGAVVNVPCPSQTAEFETKLTADYWHDVRQALRQKYGDIGIVCQCAAAGDLSPHILQYREAQRRRFSLKYDIANSTDEQNTDNERKDIAERIACAFDEVYSWAKKDINYNAKVEHLTETVELSRRFVTDEEYDFCIKNREEAQKIEFFIDKTQPEKMIFENSKIIAQKNRFNDVIDRYNSQKEVSKLPMETHAVAIGGAAFVTNRFELYMDYMHRIQARSPFTQTFIAQLAAVPGKDGGGYLGTQRSTDNKGYGSCIFDNPVSPEGGQELVEASVRLLKTIYQV